MIRFQSVRTGSGTDRYYGICYDPSRQPSRKWIALGTSDKSVARQRWAKLERKAELEGWDPWTDPKPDEDPRRSVKEALQAYRKEVLSNRRPQTQRTTGSRYDNWLRWLRETEAPGYPLKAVKPSHIRDFFRSRPGRYGGAASPATLEGYYGSLAAFFEWCVGQGWISASPIENVERPESVDDSFAVLTPSEVRRVVDAIRADTRPSAPGASVNRLRDRAYLASAYTLAACTGLRVAELCALRWTDIELPERPGDGDAALYVRAYGDSDVEDAAEGFRPKTSASRRRVPLVARAAGVLYMYRSRFRAQNGSDPPPHRIVLRSARGHPALPQTLSKRWAEYRRQAQLGRRVKLHDLRHTFISWMANDLSLPLPLVQRLAGHGTIERTRKYVRVSSETIADQLDRALGREVDRGRPKTYEAVARYLETCEAGWWKRRVRV